MLQLVFIFIYFLFGFLFCRLFEIIASEIAKNKHRVYNYKLDLLVCSIVVILWPIFFLLSIFYILLVLLRLYIRGYK